MSRDPRRPPQGGAGVTHVCHIKATTSLACVKGRHANQPWYLSCTILYKTKLRLGEKTSQERLAQGKCTLQPGGPSFCCQHKHWEAATIFPKGLCGTMMQSTACACSRGREVDQYVRPLACS